MGLYIKIRSNPVQGREYSLESIEDNATTATVVDTVDAYLFKRIKRGLDYRLEKMRAIPAPECIINNIADMILEIAGKDESFIAQLVDCKTPEVFSWYVLGDESRTGNGGKKYSRITCVEGVINYFPNAKYGRFLSIEK